MIKEPPRLTIRRRPPAPAAELLAPFLEAPTGWLVDAMSGRGAMDAAIKPLAPDVRAMRRFAGPALTCWCGPNDNLALLAAVALAEPGDVVVAACEGFAGAGMVGDLAAGMARNRGVAALVTDGMVRDRDGILAVGLPVFCRGVTPNSCVRQGPGTVGLPITAGGVSIATGDLVLGDADGVVVVPAQLLAEVGTRLTAVRAAERAAEARVRAGAVTLPEISALLESKAVHWVA
jgi:4-hydroxy-4-methyl-2-oxoglutarate aldolase